MQLLEGYKVFADLLNGHCVVILNQTFEAIFLESPLQAPRLGLRNFHWSSGQIVRQTTIGSLLSLQPLGLHVYVC